MDINSLKPSVKELVINLPDGTPTDIKLSVQGQDTKAFREAAKAFAQRQIERKDKSLDLNEMEKQRLELALICVVGWEGLEEPDADGNLNPVPFSKAKAKELLSMPELAFIVEQLEEFVTSRANFFRGKSV